MKSLKRCAITSEHRECVHDARSQEDLMRIFNHLKPTPKPAFPHAVVRFLLLLGLASCTTTAVTFNFSAPGIGPSTHKLDADLKAITVSIGRPDEMTGRICPCLNPQIAVAVWKVAVEEAITRTAIFNDDSPRRLSLQVKILQIDPTVTGTSASVEARYELIDRATGATIYSQNVSSTGTTPFFDYPGMTRLIESVNRSVQNNISSFLMNLETVDLDRPISTAHSMSSRDAIGPGPQR
jgi:hypothetical protein